MRLYPPASTPTPLPAPSDVPPNRSAAETLERVWAAYNKAWNENEACDYFTNRERGIREALLKIKTALTA